ncbi:MAG: transporter substrate-binding domain-containing protein [Clostridiales bacterium]|nr:transporter substrate-binding domain-containing protein [Clostridiales bacterium]
MKKLLSIFLIVVLLSLVTSCTNDENLINNNILISDIETEEPLHEKIRIGTMDSYSSFIVTENGNVTGPFIDILSKALDNLGYEYEFVILPWSRLMNSVGTGEVDMALPFYDKSERRKFAYYSEEPIGFSQINAVVLPDSKVMFDGSMASLSEHRIGIVQDYFYTTELENAVKENIITTDEAVTTEENIEKLLQGRVDLIFEDMSVVKEYIKTNKIDAEVKFFDPPLTYSYLYTVFSKNENLTEIRLGFDEQLKIMKSDHSLQNILENYDLAYYNDLFKLREQMNPAPERYFQQASNMPLTVGVLGNTKPYVYYEKDMLTGFSIELFTEVFTRIGVEIEFVDIPFNRMLEELKSGSLDIGTDLYLKPERQEYAVYPSLPYAGYPTVLFKKSDMRFEFTGDLKELIPYTIGYVRGYSLGPLDTYKDSDTYDFSLTDSPEQNMENLNNSRLDLIIDIKSTGENIIDQLNLSEEIIAVDPPIFYDYSYMVFSKKSNLDKLVTEYELTVKAMFEDKTIEMLSKKYNLPYLEFHEFRE